MRSTGSPGTRGHRGGPQNLVLSVARAVSEHLDAQWVVFALCATANSNARVPAPDDVRGRHGIRLRGVASARVPSNLPDDVLNRLNDILRRQSGRLERPVVDQHHLHLPLELDGRVVGGLSAWTRRAVPWTRPTWW